MNLVGLANYMANAGADYIEAQRRIDTRLADARLKGAAEALFLVGYGRTPTDVVLTVLDFVRANPRPVDLSAGRKEMKAWYALVEANLLPTLTAMAAA